MAFFDGDWFFLTGRFRAFGVAVLRGLTSNKRGGDPVERAAAADLTIRGAIPPYNEVLGSKLVAMLMMSPEVVADTAAAMPACKA